MSIWPIVQKKNYRTVPFSNWNYWIFFVLFIAGGFWFLIMDQGPNLNIFNGYSSFTEVNDHRNDTDVESLFTIRTKGCTISGLQAFDDAIMQYVVKPQAMNCSYKIEAALSASNATHLWILKENYSKYGITDHGQLLCCFRVFFRTNFIRDINADGIDQRVKYEHCEEFDSVVEIKVEFVRVNCKYENQPIYIDYHFFVPLDKIKVDSRLNKTGFNVLVIGIDAVSRMNFHRTMPKTLGYLQSMDAIELLGYNKVGDNTFPNLVPLLMGMSESELKYSCYPKKESSFDNCPLVWNNFKAAGFVTALAEDSSALGTFNYVKNGFISSPTDYYLHPFIYEAESNIGHNRDFNSFVCMGNRFSYEMLLSYIVKFTEAVKEYSYFGFFWEITMSHDYLNYPALMDDKYKDFFNNLNDGKKLEESIIIAMSDHGIRWGDIRNTKQGRLEERLPFVFVVLPKSFKKKFPAATSNLRGNARRLTTPFDLHQTLMDLVDTNEIADVRLADRSKAPYADSRGITLFLPILENRTCKTAQIDDHWCTCHRSESLSVGSKLAQEAASSLVYYLNKLLSRYQQCAKLSLARVVDASHNELSESALTSVTEMWSDYTVVVETKPGSALFEATLRHDRLGAWTVSGTVSRINLYGKQSSCVDNYNIKLYCYCY